VSPNPSKVYILGFQNFTIAPMNQWMQARSD
jgi:hypothetical protein